MYTFRILADYSRTGIKVFECCKWEDDYEPSDVYTVIVKPRSSNCNCYARGECRHMRMARDIITNNLEYDLLKYTWDYDGVRHRVTDLEYA